MRMHRWVRRSIPLATAAVVGLAPAALAQYRQNQTQGRELFEWSGGVDREVQIVMRGSQVWTNNIGQTEPRNHRARAVGTLPRQDGDVVVQVVNGRGDVDIIQQPDARNGYSTIVRIRDSRSGSDMYRLTAYYQGYENGDIYGGGRGRGRAAERSHGQRGDEMRRRDDDNDRDRNGQPRQSGQYGQYSDQTMMHWSGNVDDELEIRLQNGRVEYRTVRGAQPTSIRVNAGNTSTPRSNAQLSIAQSQGRGTVQIVQQPTQWNGNTTVMRVRDPQGGYGYYEFDLIWR